MGALWSGRFKKDMDSMVKEFNASIGFDQRMAFDNESPWQKEI